MPDNMPEEIRQHLDVLYDHAPNNAKCVAALRAIAAMGPAAAPAVPYIASALERPSCPSNEEAAETLIRIGRAIPNPTAVIEPVIVAFGVGGRHGRARALRVLRALRARQAVPAIASAISDSLRSGDDVRVFQELGGMSYLMESLKGDSPEVRRMAVRVLPAMGSDWAAQALVGALDDEDEKVRQFALQGLVEIRAGHRREIRVNMADAMFDALKSPDSATRRFAVSLIAKSMGDPTRKIEGLIPLIADPDGAVQLEVVNSLGWIGGEEIVAALGKYTHHPSDITRAAVATALGRTKETATVPFLEELLTDNAALVRENAVQSLADLQGAKFAGRMAELLDTDDDPLIMRRILQILGEWRSKEHLGDLTRFLEAGDESVRMAALDAAAGLGHAEQDTLLEALSNSSAKVREYASRKLRGSFRPTPDAAKHLLSLTGHPDPKTRGHVFALLAHRDCKISNLEPVTNALDDRDAAVLASAISILDRHGDRTVLDKVRPMVRYAHDRVAGAALDMMFHAGDVEGVAAGRKHYHHRVREKAGNYLARMDSAKVKEVLARKPPPRRTPPPPSRSTRTVPARYVAAKDTPETLVRKLRLMHAYPRDSTRDKLVAMGPPAVEHVAVLLAERSPGLRAAAVEVLGRIGDQAALNAVVGAMSDDAPTVRESAAVALGNIGERRALDALAEATRNPDWHLRSAAVRGLGRIGGAKTLDSLLKALRDPHWYVRGSAASALASLGNDAVPDLIAALRDDHWYVRQAAHAALKIATRERFGPDAEKWQNWHRGE